VPGGWPERASKGKGLGAALDRGTVRFPTPGRAVWVLLLLALVVRLAVVAGTDLHLSNPGQDPYDYDQHARSIASGHGYPESKFTAHGPSAFRPPGYPHFLAAVYKLTGNRIGAARVVQAILGTLTVGLIGILAWRICGRRVAIAALALASIYPPLIIVGSTLLTEVLFVPLELAALALALEYRRRGQAYPWAVAAGVAAGLAVLTRTNGAVLLLPLAIAVFPPRARISWRALRAPAIVVVAALLTIAPWTIRNARVMHSFVPVTTEPGVTLAGTYSHYARTYPGGHADLRAPFFAPEFAAFFRDRHLQEPALEHKLRTAAFREIRHHPTYVLKVAFWNTARLLHLSGTGGYNMVASTDGLGISRGLADVGVFSFYPVALLALFGAFTSAARRAPLYFWLTPVLFASVVLIVGFTRFRAPIDPFIIILAALAITSGVTRMGLLGSRPSWWRTRLRVGGR
jgi:4-amino-4-deoxy-L-arabinose transferase-like glycosyltransferase